jgi:hypothetical protein
MQRLRNSFSMLGGMVVSGSLLVITDSGANCQLPKFYRIGQEYFMEDGISKDEIEAELAPITVQLAYVRQVSRILNYNLKKEKRKKEKEKIELKTIHKSQKLLYIFSRG